MTLGDFFQAVSDEPVYVTFFFTIIPFTALFAGWLAKGEGEESPWKYLYSTLLYLVCVPGIFAVTLGIYLFLFERRSIMDTNVLTQVLPIASMILTILIIRKNVNMDYVPGVNKLSGLIMMITSAMAVMWFIDKTRIIIFSYMPIHQVLILFVVLFIIIRFGWSKFMKG